MMWLPTGLLAGETPQPGSPGASEKSPNWRRRDCRIDVSPRRWSSPKRRRLIIFKVRWRSWTCTRVASLRRERQSWDWRRIRRRRSRLKADAARRDARCATRDGVRCQESANVRDCCRGAGDDHIFTDTRVAKDIVAMDIVLMYTNQRN